ncbi:uncharacterized protein YlbG (UPF0298 family) [Cohnella thailandensis]|nr:uncharacterized protein YlbG (UPF0298 family) [Cohnella thailandensis]
MTDDTIEREQAPEPIPQATQEPEIGVTRMFGDRTGFIVWYSDWKAARGLDKYGTLHYLSRKMHYAVLYVNSDVAEETLKNLQRLSYVKKIERSFRNEIKTEYERNVPDKTRFYGL